MRGPTVVRTLLDRALVGRRTPDLLLPAAVLLAAFGFGLVIAGRPFLTAVVLGAALAAAWAVAAGARHARAALGLYVVALAVLPTVTVRIMGMAVPIAASDLLLAVVLLMTFVTPPSREPLPRAFTVTGRWLVTLNVAVLLSIAFAPLASAQPDIAGSLLRYMRFLPCLLLMIVIARLGAGSDRGRGLVSIAFAGITVQAAMGIVSFLTQTPFLMDPERRAEQYIWLRGEVLTRAQGTLAESSSLAHLMGIGCLLALFYGTTSGRWVRRLGLLAGTACAVCLVLSYSRGMVLSLMLGVGVFVALTRGGRRARWFVAAAAALTLALALLSFAGHDYLGLLWSRFTASAGVGYSGGVDVYLSGRIGMWERLATFLQENPAYILFGIGYKTIASSGPFQSTVGDNNYVSMLIECGLFGLVALIGLLVSCLRGAWALRGSAVPGARETGALLFALWVQHAAFLLVGDAMTYWRSMPILFLLQFALTRSAPEPARAG